MADTLVERVTGRPADQAVPIAVNMVISDQALLGVENAGAVIAGYGSVPSAIAQDLISQAVADQRSQANIPKGFSRLHQRARPTLPHALLRRTDPAPRPRHAASGRWADQSGQRPGYV